MFNQVMDSDSVRKLKELINDRFQRDLSIQSILPVDLNKERSEEYRIIDGDLVIPIWVQNRFFATAKIPRVSEFTDSEREAINQLVKLILEPTFYGWYLGQIADNAEAMKNYSAVRPMHVVVPKGDSALQRDSETDEFSIDDFSLESDLGPIEMRPHFLFLEGRTHSNIIKLAVQIHELTSNWASLRFHEITDGTTTANEILNMGSITLVIEDILNLSPEQRALLLSILRAPQTVESPLILIGSTSTLESMETEEMLPTDLVKLFKDQRIDIERLPTDQPKREEIIQLLLGPAVMV
jgi:hypothetical protein